MIIDYLALISLFSIDAVVYLNMKIQTRTHQRFNIRKPEFKKTTDELMFLDLRNLKLPGNPKLLYFLLVWLKVFEETLSFDKIQGSDPYRKRIYNP